MTPPGSVGVAVVGLGIGEQHARAYAADPRASVRWLHDLDPARTVALAQSFPGARAAPDLDAILSDPDTGIVSVASFDQDHFSQAMAALAAGKHVFVEKPLCRTQDELAQLKQRWMQAGGRLKLGSNLILRAAPLYRWLKARIESGELGRLYAFDGLKREWREAAENLGGTTLDFWRRVGLPILFPSFLGATVLLFGNSFAAYATAEALTGSKVDVITRVISMQIRGDVMYNPNLSYAIALGMMVVLRVSILLYVLLQQRTAKWLR